MSERFQLQHRKFGPYFLDTLRQEDRREMPLQEVLEKLNLMDDFRYLLAKKNEDYNA